MFCRGIRNLFFFTDRTHPEGQYLYILDEAVAEYAGRINEMKKDTPVPPCIMYVEPEGCQIALEVEDKATKPDIIKISADSVRIAIISSVSHDHANEEILEFMAKVLVMKLKEYQEQRILLRQY